MHHLNTVLIWSTYVGPAVDVERLSIRHVKHANREPALLSLTVIRVPLECGVDWTTGKENGSEYLLLQSGSTAMQLNINNTNTDKYHKIVIKGQS